MLGKEGGSVSKEDEPARVRTKGKLKQWRELEGKPREEKTEESLSGTKRQITRKNQRWGLSKGQFNFSRSGQSCCNYVRFLRVENKGI